VLGNTSGQEEVMALRRIGKSMEPEHVSDGFIIHALIIDLMERGRIIQRDEPLSFPHKSVHQIDRFKEVIQDRNNRFSSYLRPEYNHACDLCTKLIEASDKKGMPHSKQYLLCHNIVQSC
jgi:hypothetical protein